MAKWVTADRGIRYRQHPTRKHGVKFDRYFTLRFSARGHQVEEALGWSSDGWTIHLAKEELVRLKKAGRSGAGPMTLREEREVNRRAELDRAEADATRARLAKTVSDLWDRYAVEVVAVENKPRTVAEKHRMWRRIMPAIGHLKIDEVTEEDAGKVVRAPLRLDDAGRVAGGKAQAGNLYRLLHHMFAAAIRWRLRSRGLGNPLENVAEPKVSRRERLLTSDEVGALLRALDTLPADRRGQPQALAVLHLAILTGCRIRELLTLRWENVRRDEREIHLPDTKTGFSRRPISAAALTVLDSVGRMPGSPWVFRGTTNPRRHLSYEMVRRTFHQLADAAGVRGCTLHTLRHWFATQAANSVANPRVGMSLTGHKSLAAYHGYVHAERGQAHALAEQLATIAGGFAAAGSNVVELPAGTQPRKGSFAKA
jgi:integrase